MTKLERLKREAREAATRRGHTLVRFYRNGIPAAEISGMSAECSQCGMSVTVRPKPMPNEIDIGGEAVALNCRGSR